MKGKLKTLEEILKNTTTSSTTDNALYTIFHSKVYKSIVIKTIKNFGNIVDISLWETFDDRVIYKDNLINKQLYYDEWFEWIGKPPKPPLEDEFDNLINAIEGW